ncbi:MAG TPA: hypothetical protein PKD59_08980 [Miltoncostaeaceae bacterium]|nr:hypothetical protein [Miltoncostaeaceae bacterium]
MPTAPSRHAGIATLMAAAVAAVAFLPAAAVAKDPPRLIKADRINSVACLPGAANTVRADVRLRMSVVNYHGFFDWADHMEARARLEPTTTGIKTGTWARWKTPYLTQDKRHVYDIRLTTDNRGGSLDWRLHVKLIWHRSAPTPNVTKDVYLPFDESCAPETGGGGGAPGGGIPLNPAPANPSVG